MIVELKDGQTSYNFYKIKYIKFTEEFVEFFGSFKQREKSKTLTLRKEQIANLHEISNLVETDSFKCFKKVGVCSKCNSSNIDEIKALIVKTNINEYKAKPKVIREQILRYRCNECCTLTDLKKNTNEVEYYAK